MPAGEKIEDAGDAPEKDDQAATPMPASPAV
jgi:hypothetical protein